MLALSRLRRSTVLVGPLWRNRTMKSSMFIRSAIAAAVALGAGLASAASVYPDFTVSTAALGGGGKLGTFTANDISGQYHEQLTFTSDSTFVVTLDFVAQ